MIQGIVTDYNDTFCFYGYFDLTKIVDHLIPFIFDNFQTLMWVLLTLFVFSVERVFCCLKSISINLVFRINTFTLIKLIFFCFTKCILKFIRRKVLVTDCFSMLVNLKTVDTENKIIFTIVCGPVRAIKYGY